MVYSAGIVGDAFWFLESKKTAEFLVEGLSKEEIMDKSLIDNVYQFETERRKRQVVNVTYRRLSNFNIDGLKLFLDLNNENAKIFNLITILCDDELFFEFMYEVFRNKLIVNDFKLKNSDFSLFFKDKKSKSEKVDNWKDLTINKLKFKYTEVLKASGVIINKDKSKFIEIPFIDFKLKEYLINNDFKPYLNIFTGDD